MGIDCGRVGELLTAYHLEKHGVMTSMVDRRGPDIWCKLPDDRMIRVEVKTASRPTPRNSREDPRDWSYSFQVRRREADMYALVALDRSIVLFKPWDFLKTHVTQRIHQSEFNLDNMVWGLQDVVRGPGR